MSKYSEQWRELNEKLRELETRSGDLRAVFDALREHQIGTGFIHNGTGSVERFEFCDPERDTRCFRIQLNPDRAVRFRGAGLQSPPDGVADLNGGCFLCADNIRWQQRERQFGYELALNGRLFIAWMNPFPLLPQHLIVAAEEHLGQEWSLHPAGCMEPQRIAADIVDLVSRSPGHTCFYNGVDAGASIPGHLHYQMFGPLEGHRKFPLEIEAMAARKEHPGLNGWRLGDYPMESMHWHGTPGEVVKQFDSWIGEWAGHQHDLAELAANIIATSDETDSRISLFFVPRDRRKSRVSGIAGRVGGLEVLGELVFSTPEEQRLLESGQLDFFNLEQVLARARTPLNMP